MRIKIDFKVNPFTEKEVKNAIFVGLTESAIVVHGDAVKNSPVETGLLQNNMFYDVYDDIFQAIIYNTMEYAPHVEYMQNATPRRKGKIPFMRPALYDNKKKINAIMKSALDRNL